MSKYFYCDTRTNVCEIKERYCINHEQIYLSPVVQSIVSLTSSLMANWLSVAANVFSNIFIFLLQKCEQLLKLQRLLTFLQQKI